MLVVSNAGSFMKKKTDFHRATLQEFAFIQKQKLPHPHLMDIHILHGSYGIQKKCLEKM